MLGIRGGRERRSEWRGLRGGVIKRNRAEPRNENREGMYFEGRYMGGGEGDWDDNRDML